jgi:hypothetical protein
LIEEWMKQFEEEMMRSVRMKIKIAYNKYYDESDDNQRNKWVLAHLSQSVAIVDQIVWTEGTEAALNELADEPFAMEDHFEVMKINLNEFVELIRG